MMTVKDYKEIFGIKPKIEIEDDYVLLTEDIVTGRIFPSFYNSNNLSNIISGLYIDGHEVYYVQPEVFGIEIVTDSQFPPCGGSVEVIVEASYALRATKTDGEVSYMGDREKSLVNAIISIENLSAEGFEYINKKVVKETPNYGDEPVECRLFSSYYHKGNKFTHEKTLSQATNETTEWRLVKESTNFIGITLDEDHFSNKGGITTAKVERYFSRLYAKYDSCGQIVGEKNEPDLVDDITSKALITSSNRTAFSVSRNIITVSKQEIGAPKREGKISARYLGFTASAPIYQQAGGDITYGYVLSFQGDEEGKKIVYRDLDTALPTDFVVYFSSKQLKYSDGELIGESTSNNLKIEFDQDWLSGTLGEDGNGIFLKVSVSQTNTSTEEEREATITITNVFVESLSLNVVVLQPSNDIIGEYYQCRINGDREFKYDTLTNRSISFELMRYLVYEDKSEVRIASPVDIKAQIEFASTNDDMLKVRGVDRDGDMFYPKYINLVERSISDVTLGMKAIFKDVRGNKVAESDKFSITVRGKDVVSYMNELCFKDHEKYHEEIWSGDKEPRFIDIISETTRTVNGINSEKTAIPIRAISVDDFGNPYFDDAFSLKVVDGARILVFPYNVRKTTEKTYTITQVGNEEKLYLRLLYDETQKNHDVHLKVQLKRDSGFDVWTGRGGFLLIDGKTVIGLEPCWLSTKMKDRRQVVYEGTIAMSQGEHKIESFNIYAVNKAMKMHKDCNFSKDIYVDGSNKDVELIIEA